MTAMIMDSQLEERLIAERRALGHDRFDEVWDGVYVIAPLANNEHQNFSFRLGMALQTALGFDSDSNVYAGVNVSDRRDDWTKNYRCPDVAVVLPGGAGEDCGEFLFGGPDFVAEIVSPNDRSWEKIPFYGRIGVQELLLADRDPWSLELYRLAGRVLPLAGRGAVDDQGPLKSSVLPVSFRLISDAKAPRPRLEVVHDDGQQRWLV